MLTIGHSNLFIANATTRRELVKVLKFYDVNGINWIYLHSPASSLKYSFVSNKAILYIPSKLSEILSNNLFRVDMIVIESTGDIIDTVRRFTDLPVIIISSQNVKLVKLKKYDYSYKFIPLSDSVEKMTTKEIINLSYLEASIISDMKIDIINDL